MDRIFQVFFSPGLWFSAIALSTPILLAAMGAHISLRAGIINIGLEGIMLIGALVGVLFSGLFLTFSMATPLNLIITFILIICVGILCGFFIGYFHLKFDADIGLSGIMFNLIASGLTVYILYLVTGDKGVSSSYPSLTFPKVHIPFLKEIPFIGTYLFQVLSGHYLLTHVGFASVVLITFVMKRTTLGLRLKAVGESPEAVASVGLSVSRLKLLAISLSGGLAALGGASLSMGIFQGFVQDMVAGRGFISLSANTLGGSPVGGMLVSLLFGTAGSLGINLQIFTRVPAQIVQMLPYLLTLITLIVYSYIKMKKGEKNESIEKHTNSTY